MARPKGTSRSQLGQAHPIPIRFAPDEEALLRLAATLRGQPHTAFAREAALEAATQVLEQHPESLAQLTRAVELLRQAAAAGAQLGAAEALGQVLGADEGAGAGADAGALPVTSAQDALASSDPAGVVGSMMMEVP